MKASTYALERSAHNRPSARQLFLGGTRPLQQNISKKLKNDAKTRKIFFSAKKNSGPKKSFRTKVSENV